MEIYLNLDSMKSLDIVKLVASIEYWNAVKIKIDDNTFAAACYNDNTINELYDALKLHTVDKTDCEKWGIGEPEWRASIKLALLQLIKRDALDN